MPDIPGLLPREARDEDLLGCFSFQVSPPRRRAADTIAGKEDDAWRRLPSYHGELERRLMDHLAQRLDMRLRVVTFFRRGSFEIFALVLGTYTVLKDYKTLRDSLTTLRNDVVKPFITEDLDLPGWRVEATVWTPGTPDQTGLVSGVRMDLGVRYAFLYLMITNVALILFLGLLLILPTILGHARYPF
jgi:hypothetical protein